MSRATVPALALLALLTTACASSVDSVTVGGERIAVAPLVDGHRALCQAAARPDNARALFFDRSHEALHAVARAMEDVDRAQAGELLQAKEKVESGLVEPPATLPDDLRRLAGVYRTALGRLAIEAKPCDK